MSSEGKMLNVYTIEQINIINNFNLLAKIGSVFSCHFELEIDNKSEFVHVTKK